MIVMSVCYQSDEVFVTTKLINLKKFISFYKCLSFVPSQEKNIQTLLNQELSY